MNRRRLLDLGEQVHHARLLVARGRLHPQLDAHRVEFLERLTLFGRDGHVLVDAGALVVEAHAGDVEIIEIEPVLTKLEGVDGVAHDDEGGLLEGGLREHVDRR